MSFRCKLLSLDSGRWGSWQDKTIERKANLDSFLQNYCSTVSCENPCHPGFGEGGESLFGGTQKWTRQVTCFWFLIFLCQFLHIRMFFRENSTCWLNSWEPGILSVLCKGCFAQIRKNLVSFTIQTYQMKCFRVLSREKTGFIWLIW